MQPATEETTTRHARNAQKRQKNRGLLGYLLQGLRDRYAEIPVRVERGRDVGWGAQGAGSAGKEDVNARKIPDLGGPDPSCPRQLRSVLD
jgi:hypothetical protein